MQNRIIHDNSLFRDDGRLREAGYSFKYLLNFENKKVKLHKSRIKSFDSYIIQSHNIFIRLSLADFYHYGIMHYYIIDTNTLETLTKTQVIPYTKGRMRAPETPLDGSWRYIAPKFLISFNTINNHRELCLNCRHVYNKKKDISLTAHITKQDIPYLCLTTELTKKYTFNYLCKAVGLRTKGYIIQNKERVFLSEDETFTSFFWDRFVSDKASHEYTCATLTTKLDDDKTFSFSFGYGLGNDSQATENFMIYDNNPIKLEDVTIVPSFKRRKKINYNGKWRIVDSQRFVDLTFEPIHTEKTSSMLKSKLNCHHLYGYYSGTCVIDNNTKIELKNVKGFLSLTKLKRV